MKPTFFVWLLLLLAAPALRGQANPFELRHRLPATAVLADSATTALVATGNPFDLRPRLAGAAAPRASAPAAAPGATGQRARSGPLVIQSTDPNKGKGSLLAIHIILLLALAGLWLLFGDLLRQCLRSMVNDALMNQLYSRRSGGELTALWSSYFFFFLACGFFLYLLTTHFDISTGFGIWGGWLVYSLTVAAAVGLKNFLLVVYASLFPVQREISRYVFVIMVFSILTGLFIAPVNLLISYAPETWRPTFIYAGATLIVVTYLLHLVRGVFIANRLLASRPVHILLYICTIEIAPLLLIYRYLSDTIA